MKVFEVTAAGYNGESEETDDRVIWIAAADAAQVQAAIEGLGAKFWSDQIPQQSEELGDAVDFTLPADRLALRDKLQSFKDNIPFATDSQVTLALLEEAKRSGLDIDHRAHGGSFRTVYLSAKDYFKQPEQFALLSLAKQHLHAAGIPSAKLTRYDNPPYFNKNTGKTEAGHPRHGDPLLEIDSVWWVKDVADAFMAKVDEERMEALKAKQTNASW